MTGGRSADPGDRIANARRRKGGAVVFATVLMLVTPTTLGFAIPDFDPGSAAPELDVAGALAALPSDALTSIVPRTGDPKTVAARPTDDVIAHVLDQLPPAIAHGVRATLPITVAEHLEAVEARVREKAEERREGREISGLRTFPAGETTTLGGAADRTLVIVDEDWSVEGPLVLDNVELVFRTTNGRPAIVGATGVPITITNSRVRHEFEDRLRISTLTIRGPARIENTHFSEVTVRVAPPPGTLGAEDRILTNVFDHTEAALFVEGNPVIDRNIFTRNAAGLVVYRASVVGGASPLVIRNVFEMNREGLRLGMDASGTYGSNHFAANTIGISCNSAARQNGQDSVRVVVNDSLFEGNYGDAIMGVSGVTIKAKAGAIELYEVTVLSSRCIYRDNHYGGPSLSDPRADSLFIGDSDEIQGVRATPPALGLTPPLPWPLLKIVTNQVWDEPADLPAVNGPVVVSYPGRLEIRSMALDVGGFPLGSKKAGSLRIESSSLTNSSGVFIRNDGDVIRSVRLEGSLPLDGLWVHRANVTVSDLTLRTTPTNGFGIALWAPFPKENANYLHQIERPDIEGAGVGVAEILGTLILTAPRVAYSAAGVASLFSKGKVTVNDGTFELNGPAITSFLDGAAEIQRNTFRPAPPRAAAQLSRVDASEVDENYAGTAVSTALSQSISASDNVVQDVGAGFVLTIAPGGVQVQRNRVERVQVALVNVVSSITSDNNDIDRALYGYRGFLGLGGSFTAESFTNLGFAFLSNDLTMPNVKNSLFAYNFMGLGVTDHFAQSGSPVILAASNLNFIHNVGSAAYAWSVKGAPVGIACGSCWKETDEIVEGTDGSTWTLVANPGRLPSWWAQATVVESGSFTLPPTLAGPVVARSGGQIRLVDAESDARGFLVGAKGGSNPGSLEFRRATLRSAAAVASAGPQNLLDHVELAGFRTGLGVGLHGASASLHCVRIEGAADSLGTFKGGTTTLTSTLVRDSKGPTFGYHRRVAGDDGAVTVRESAFLDLSTPMTRPADATLRLTNSSVSSDTSQLIFADWPFPSPPAGAPRVDVGGTYWGSSAGPSVYHVQLNGEGNPVKTKIRSGEGGSLELYNDPQTGLGTYEPVLTAPPAVAPCAEIRASAPSTVETSPLAFTDHSFDPMGGLLTRSWDFGDGTPVVADGPGAVTHRFADAGSYTVTVTVTNAAGLATSASTTVTVTNVPPLADFTWTGTLETDTFGFTSTSTHPNEADAPPAGWTFAWSFPAVGGSGVENPEVRFPNGGAKAVRLTVTDNDGLTSTVEKVVDVEHVAPIADFTIGGTWETDTYVLTDTSTHPNAPTNGISSRTWSCSDGFQAGNLPTVTHRFVDGGPKSCTLKVWDQDGLTATVTRGFTVAHASPLPNFVHAGSTETDTFAFTDTSTHPNAPRDSPPSGWTFAWDFDDGATSTARHPTHRFADGGSYAVTLTATDNDGLSASVTRTVAVAHRVPSPAFTWSPQGPEPGQEVAFTDASSHANAPNDGIVSWAWDFGDGSTSSARHPTHAFAERQRYDVSLTVTDDDGLSATLVRSIGVGNEAPVAGWSYCCGLKDAPAYYAFTDASSDADGTIVSRVWNWGDGSTTLNNLYATHSFSAVGAYNVCLTVTDDVGASSTSCGVVYADDRPNVLDVTAPVQRSIEQTVVKFRLTMTDGSVIANTGVVLETWMGNYYEVECEERCQPDPKICGPWWFDVQPPEGSDPLPEPQPQPLCERPEPGEPPRIEERDGFMDAHRYVAYTDVDGWVTFRYYSSAGSNTVGEHTYRAYFSTNAGYLGNTEYGWRYGHYEITV